MGNTLQKIVIRGACAGVIFMGGVLYSNVESSKYEELNWKEFVWNACTGNTDPISEEIRNRWKESYINKIL
ncbi:hypothetical protein KAI32_00505 [Candidatus Pacearchaeota archaeon]|nr:hypothetical protein [Candidatus Pacearchaeota archaeon]